MLDTPKEVEAPPLKHCEPDFDIDIPEPEYYDYISSSSFDIKTLCMIISIITLSIFIR